MLLSSALHEVHHVTLERSARLARQIALMQQVEEGEDAVVGRSAVEAEAARGIKLGHVAGTPASPGPVVPTLN